MVIRTVFALAALLLPFAVVVPARAQQDVRPYAGIEPARPQSNGPGEQPQAYTGDSALARQLSNPVANLISVPIQNNLDYGGGRGSAFRYTLNVQPVIAFMLNDDWNLITRTILPLQHIERVFPDYEGGLGDVV